MTWPRLGWLCAMLGAANVGIAQTFAEAICGYQVTSVIRAPFCTFSETYPPITATDISPNGRYVCGSFPPCSFGLDRAFVYDRQTDQFTTIPLPNGISRSFAYGVNDSGMVAGKWGGSAGDFGYVYNVQTGQYTNLPPINAGGTCSANAINNAGSACGWRSIGSRNDASYPFQAFIWSNGFTDLGLILGPNSSGEDINDQNTVAGWTGSNSSSANVRGFIADQGRIIILPPVPGGTTSSAAAISSNNVVVGRGRIPGNGLFPIINRAFVYDHGAMRILQPLPGFVHSSANGVSDDGIIVGISKDLVTGEAFYEAQIWIGSSTYALKDLLPPGSGLSALESASGIIDLCVVKGTRRVLPMNGG